MKVTISCKKVAGVLKLLVNHMCEDDFQWYPDAAEEDNADTTIFDFAEAIKVLETIEDKTIQIGEGAN